MQARSISGANAPHYYEHDDQPYEGIRAYIGMCNMIDIYVGRLVDHLDMLRTRENTLIIFTADHGDHKLEVYRDAEYGELYNLAQDPEQRRNLWDQAEHAALKSHLLLRLTRADIERAGQLPPRVNHA